MVWSEATLKDWLPFPPRHTLAYQRREILFHMDRFPTASREKERGSRSRHKGGRKREGEKVREAERLKLRSGLSKEKCVI